MSSSVNAATEPVLATATVTSIVSAGIALLVSFGLDLDSAQTGAILAFVALLAPFISGYFQRRKVTPNAKVLAFVPDPAVDGPVAGDALPNVPNGTPVTVAEAA